MERERNDTNSRQSRRCRHGKFHKRHHHRAATSQLSETNTSMSKVNSQGDLRKTKSKRRKEWDSTVSNLDDYKLDEVKQVEKKLNRVSKHRHYAKELVRQQKRKHAEKKREEEEQKQLDLERRQLIQRKHGILRGMPLSQSNNERVFAKFTQNKRLNDSDSSMIDSNNDESHSASDYDSFDIAQSGYNSDCEQTTTIQQNNNNNNDNNTLHSDDTSIENLTNQINTLEEQIARLEKKQQQCDYNQSDSKLFINKQNEETSMLPPHLGISSIINKNNENNPNILNVQNIQNKLNSLQSSTVKITKTPTKRVAIKSSNNGNENDDKTNEFIKDENLSLTLSKIRDCLHDIEIQRNNYEQFKNTLLELINAQNTQILKLVSSMATQQTQINKLQQTVEKLEKTTIHINPDITDETWHATKEPQITITSHIKQPNIKQHNNNDHQTDKPTNNLHKTATNTADTGNNPSHNKQANTLMPNSAIASNNTEIGPKTSQNDANIAQTANKTEMATIGPNEPSLSAMLLDQSTDWKSIAALIPSNYKRTQIIDKSQYPSMRVYMPQDPYFPNKGFDYVSPNMIENDYNNYMSRTRNQQVSSNVIRTFLPPKTNNLNNDDSKQMNGSQIDSYNNEVLPNRVLPKPVPKMSKNLANNTNNATNSTNSSLDRLVHGNITVTKFDENNGAPKGTWNISNAMMHENPPKVRIERLNMT